MIISNNVANRKLPGYTALKRELAAVQRRICLFV